MRNGNAVREELMRYRCASDDGTYMTVIEFRHVQSIPGRPGVKRLGARHLELASGEDVRYIDDNTFEIVRSGELLRRRD